MLFIRDHQRQIFAASLFQAVRTAGARQNPIARFDRKFLAIHLHRTGAAQDVIHLVNLLQMIANGCARFEYAFAKFELEAFRLLKKAVAN